MKVFDFVSIRVVTPAELTYELVDKEKVEFGKKAYKRLEKYELLRSDKIFRLTVSGRTIHLKKALYELGFTPDVLLASSKESNFTAAKDIEESSRYSHLRERVNRFLKLVPFLNLNLPAFGRERLHIRAFKDKEMECWYVTAHIDRTNVLSINFKKLGEMIRTHLLHIIEGDYQGGTELFNEMLSSYIERNNLV